MIVVIAELRTAPGARERLAPLLVQAQAISSIEPGCLLYRFASDLADPDLTWVIEQWASAEAQEAHVSSPSSKGLITQAAALGVTGLKVTSHFVSSSEVETPL
jgi:quinol monooxygenase YgiN